MERNMDVSRKQFLEWWRHPEQEELRKSCAEGGGGKFGLLHAQLSSWISTGPNRMATFGKMAKKALMRWAMRMV
ncbi:hypothetical protein EA579_23280, partial [Salmonella enterica subsp. enterica serovar Oranienburg]|nr:hypothetical protein [Salmonella enterica subsp. enterica serovar Oranienburg]EAR0412079.1 hypothetical protein [Salmonella enterica subsp. enterica serovar Oranienburg]